LRCFVYPLLHCLPPNNEVFLVFVNTTSFSPPNREVFCAPLTPWSPPTRVFCVPLTPRSPPNTWVFCVPLTPRSPPNTGVFCVPLTSSHSFPKQGCFVCPSLQGLNRVVLCAPYSMVSPSRGVLCAPYSKVSPNWGVLCALYSMVRALYSKFPPIRGVL
jgi:hypothetical protein